MNKWRKRHDFWEDPAEQTPGTDKGTCNLELTIRKLRSLLSSSEPGKTLELVCDQIAKL